MSDWPQRCRLGADPIEPDRIKMYEREFPRTPAPSDTGRVPDKRAARSPGIIMRGREGGEVGPVAVRREPNVLSTSSALSSNGGTK